MDKILPSILMLALLALAGCSRRPSLYQTQLAEIESSYSQGKLTTVEYLTLKQGIQNAAAQRGAIMAHAILLSP